MTLATGAVRRVGSNVPGDLDQFDWSPDGRAFVAAHSDRGRRSLYLVDAATGSSRLIVSGEATSVTPKINPGQGNLSQPRWMPDGRSIAFVRDTSVALRDLGSGEERVMLDTGQPVMSFAVALDGKSVAWVAARAVQVAGVSDGRARTLVQLRDISAAKVLTWSHDGQFVVFADRTAAALVPGSTFAYAELWRVRATGGPPERLNLAADSIKQLAISAGGRHIAFSVNADISSAVHVLDLARRK